MIKRNQEINYELAGYHITIYKPGDFFAPKGHRSIAINGGGRGYFKSIKECRTVAKQCVWQLLNERLEEAKREVYDCTNLMQRLEDTP